MLTLGRIGVPVTTGTGSFIASELEIEIMELSIEIESGIEVAINEPIDVEIDNEIDVELC